MSDTPGAERTETFLLDAMMRPRTSFFDVSRLLIHLHWDKKLEHDPVRRQEIYGELVHEFTHYLRLTTTVYGMSYLVLLADAVIRVLVHFHDGKHDRLSDELVEKIARIRRHQYFSLESRVPGAGSGDSDTERVLGKIEIPVHYVHDPRTNTEVPITPHLLREHMALMAFAIARGMGVDAIFARIEVEKVNPVYRILFEDLVFRLGERWDVRVIMFYLAELALMSNIPSVAGPRHLNDFIAFAKRNANSLSDEGDALTKYVQSCGEAGNIKTSLDKLDAMMMPISAFVDDQGNHDGVRLVGLLLAKVRAGIEFRRVRPSVYLKGLGGNWLTWCVQKFGSPLVHYESGECVLLKGSSDNRDDLGYLFALLYLVHNFEIVRGMREY